MSYLISEDFKTHEEIPFATRGFTDLWKRDWNGGKVAVKSLRFAPDDDRDKTIKVTFAGRQISGIARGTHARLQRFCKEVLLWKRLNHPNILTFYGASTNQNQFSLVCPWMESGNVLSYTRKNPKANRLRLVSTDEAQDIGMSDGNRLTVDRRGKWSQVPPQDEPSTRKHQRGMFHWCCCQL